MTTVQTYTVSDKLQELLSGVTISAGVFTTYTFDPGFFESEIVPVLFDFPLNINPDIRLHQLDSHLRGSDVSLAVFYDVDQVKNTEQRSAKLGIDRIPVYIKNGVFHPKVIVLGGTQRVDDSDSDVAVLIVGVGSGNLTKGGWWENVEHFNFEKIVEGERSRLVSDADGFLTDPTRFAEGRTVEAVEKLKSLIKTHQFPDVTQRSVNRRLHTRLLYGKQQFAQVIADAAGPSTRNLSLEIIAPYMDDTPDNKIIEKITKSFGTAKPVVMLPTDPGGNITISKEQYDWLKQQDEDGKLIIATVVQSIAKRLLGINAPDRFVHAKVYRFTDGQRKEILVGGSLNLTSAAWLGKNYEAAVLVDADVRGGVPDWLETTPNLPTTYAEAIEREDADEERPGGFPTLQFSWQSEVASIAWLGDGVPNTVSIKGINDMLASDVPMDTTGKPTDCSNEVSQAIKHQLETSSVLTVITPDGIEYPTLVWERDMYQKPPVWLGLGIKDILRYWGTLSPEQRTELINRQLLATTRLDDELTAPINYKAYETLFDRIGGVHLAFRSRQRQIDAAIAEDRINSLKALLFDRGVIGLHGLLDTLAKDADNEVNDNVRVQHYLIYRSASELVQSLKRSVDSSSRRLSLQAFFDQHHEDVRRLDAAIDAARITRELLLKAQPDLSQDSFLDWFEELHAESVDEIKAKVGV